MNRACVSIQLAVPPIPPGNFPAGEFRCCMVYNAERVPTRDMNEIKGLRSGMIPDLHQNGLVIADDYHSRGKHLI